MVNAFNGEFQMRKDNCRMKADSFPVGVDCTLSPVLPELKKSVSETLSSSSVSSTNCLVKRVVCSPDLPVYPLSIVADSTAAAASTAVSRLSYPPPPQQQQQQQQQQQPQAVQPPSKVTSALEEDEEEHSYQCNLCDKSFGQLDALSSHLKIHNGAAQSGANNVSGKDPEDPYRCNCCGKTFAVPARLTRHYRTHTGEKPYQCEFCNKSFSVKENLSVHKRIHTKERPYKCDVCDRAFEHSGKLHRHMRIHTGERPHKCNYCAKTFIQSGQLVIHLRTHTGEKPYVCKCCGKGFTCSKQLKVHTRTHTGEKPYACDICGKSFGYNHVLKLHQVAHYGEKVYKCTICKETFNSKKAMETHIKMAHSESNNNANSSAVSASSSSSASGRMNGAAVDGLAPSGVGGGGGGEGSFNSSNSSSSNSSSSSSSSSSDKENKLEIIEMTAAVPTQQPMIPSSGCSSSTGFTFEQGSSYIIPQVMAKGDLTIIPIGCASSTGSAATTMVIGSDDGNPASMCGRQQLHQQHQQQHQQPQPQPHPHPHPHPNPPSQQQQQYDGYAYTRCLTSDKPAVEQSTNGSSVQRRFSLRSSADGGLAVGPSTAGSAIVYGEEHGSNAHFRAPLCYAGTHISSSSPSLSDSSRSNSPKLEIVENAAPEDCSSHAYSHGNGILLDQQRPLPPSAMNEDACDSYLTNSLIDHVSSRYGHNGGSSATVTRSPLFSYTEQQTIISSNSANNSTSFVTIYSVPLPESCTPPSSTSTSPVPSSPDANASDALFTVDRDESNLPPRKRSKMILKSIQKAKAEETSGVRYSSVIHYAKSN